MPAPKKKPFQDYYLLMGLQQTATPSEIKTVYRELALKVHPDKNPSPEAHQQFLLLNEAYRILNNPDERNKYDIRYKHYYDPHKKSAGITERIEINRAKRASRYGRSMYSQRMRYRGSSSSGASSSRSKTRKSTYTSQQSTYNWEDEEIDALELTYKKYASVAQVMALILLLFSAYSISDYFVRVVSDKIKVVETVIPDSPKDPVKVIARKYYYQNYVFYTRLDSKHYFNPGTQVQLEKSYFTGRLYKIRAHKEGRIYLIEPTQKFFDNQFILLIFVVAACLASLLLAKSAQNKLFLASMAFVISIIGSIAV